MNRVYTTALLAVFFAVSLFLFSRNNNSTQAVLAKEDSLKRKVDRGDYLVNTIVHCTYCHSQLDITKFSPQGDTW